MTSEQIRNQMTRYETQLDDSQRKLRDLQKDQEELERLENKFNQLRSDFEGRQQERRCALSGVSGLLHVQTAVRYFNGMRSLLNGGEYGSIVNALSDGTARIRRKREETEEDICDCMRQISRCEYGMESLGLHLRLVLLQEAEGFTDTSHPM